MTEKRDLYVDDLAGRITLTWPSTDRRRVLNLIVETGGGEAEVVLTDDERCQLIELLRQPPLVLAGSLDV